jgi:hypothetical protein
MSTALADALPHLTSQRLRRIHLAGHAQLGFAYLIGDRFDRATNTELHCTGRFGDVFTNKGQSLFAPVDGGNPHCETVRPPEVPPLPDRNEIPSISLLLCREKEGEKYLSDITDHIALKHPDAHPVWVKHPLPVKPDEIMPYINDVVALLSRLYREKRVRTVHLYTSLPFHAVPLLAARLKKYVVDSVAFMEYRSDLQGTNPTAGELYSHLRMRGESLG